MKEIEKMIRELKELAPYHIHPYNLGEEGKIRDIIHKLPSSLPPSNTQEQGEDWREEFYKWKREYQNKHDKNPSVELTRNWIEDNVIQPLQQQLSSLKSKPNTTEAVSDWISVEDGLPECVKANTWIECSEEVQIFDSVHGVQQGWMKRFLKDAKDDLFPHYIKGYWLFETTNRKYENVTHWQPLPGTPSTKRQQQ